MVASVAAPLAAALASAYAAAVRRLKFPFIKVDAPAAVLPRFVIIASRLVARPFAFSALVKAGMVA